MQRVALQSAALQRALLRCQVLRRGPVLAIQVKLLSLRLRCAIHRNHKRAVPAPLGRAVLRCAQYAACDDGSRA